MGTIENLASMKCETAIKVMTNILNLYTKRVFKIEIILTNGQFEPWRLKLNTSRIKLNIVSNSEHFGDIERFI